jgi:branched-chain amino acid aminotransferase
MSTSAWFNGKLVSFDEAGLDSSGWPQGSGFFETIKTVSSQPWALSRHMRRALNTARRNNERFPSEELIRTAVAETILANPFPIGRLRLLFGKEASLIVTHQEYSERENSAKLIVRSAPAISKEISFTGIVEKRYPYTQNLQLLAEARRNGFDDCILINSNGFVSETSIANLVLQLDGQWVTPPISEGVLPGVMRALLIEKAGVLVRQIASERLSEVTAGFLVSSLKIAQPIGSIDDRALIFSSESDQKRSVFAATALATSVG